MLRTNPRVWGQVIEDRGYIAGQCSHAYRSVMFEARAEFVADLEREAATLSLLIVHADRTPPRPSRSALWHLRSGTGDRDSIRGPLDRRQAGAVRISG